MGYTIHTPPGLDHAGVERAANVGPSFIGGMPDPSQAAHMAGFVNVRIEDVSARLRETGLRWLAGMQERGSELRSELGDEEYEMELERKRCMVTGVEEGIVRRAFVVCERPA